MIFVLWFSVMLLFACFPSFTYILFLVNQSCIIVEQVMLFVLFSFWLIDPLNVLFFLFMNVFAFEYYSTFWPMSFDFFFNLNLPISFFTFSVFIWVFMSLSVSLKVSLSLFWYLWHLLSRMRDKAKCGHIWDWGSYIYTKH
jgi:hypothetical protein